MSIENLPDHILGLILSKCAPNEWNKFQLVCPQWKRVVELHLGILMVHGTPTGVTIESKQLLNRYLIHVAYSASVPALRAKKAELADHLESVQPEEDKVGDHSDAQTPVEINANEVKEVNTPKVPGADFIQKLSFVGPIPLALMDSVMTSCKSLFGIHFHFSALSGITQVDNLKMDIPTLKNLVIGTYGVKQQAQMTEQDPDFINWTQGFHVFCTVLNHNSFFHLNKLILDVPFSPENEGPVVSAISNFLSKHQSTLKTFCYHQNFISKRVKSLKIHLDDSDDSDDSDDEDVSLKSLAENATLLKNVSLENLHIHLVRPQVSDPLWKNFILHQKKLKKLVYTGKSRIPFPTATVRENSKSLQTLVLEIRDTIDLKTLAECHNLKKLVLLTASDNTDEVDHTLSRIDIPNVKNFSALPSSLEDLSIRYLKVDEQDVQGIMNGNLVNLKKLELFECGHEYNLGVPIQMMAQIWEERVLPHFVIRNSLNRESLRKKPMSPAVSLLAYVIDASYSVTNFEMEGTLNESGNYQINRLLEEEAAAHVELELDIFTFPDEMNFEGNDFKGLGHFAGDRSEDYETVTGTSDSSSSSGCETD